MARILTGTTTVSDVNRHCLVALLAGLTLVGEGCGTGCSEYASDFSCSYVRDQAEYEVWYWRNLEAEQEDDELLIGHAIGLEMCEFNAKAFAAAIGEPFNYRAYTCVLMKDGRREKHRLLSG